MKIRTDFVTNSSSSSFVIALKPDSPMKDILKKACKESDESYICPFWVSHDKEETKDEYTPEYVDVLESFEKDGYELMDLGIGFGDEVIKDIMYRIKDSVYGLKVIGELGE